MAVNPSKANHLPGWKYSASNYVKEEATRPRCTSCGKKIRGKLHDCKNGK